MSNKRTILALYKNKLKICHELGYIYGSNNIKFINRSTSIFPIKKIQRKFKYSLGPYLMNNIKYRYKLNMYEDDEDIINDHIIDGFDRLKQMNELKYIVKSKNN